MDYRALLAAPLAAVAVSASGAGELRTPNGWFGGATWAFPQGPTHEAGVAPETEADGHRALTVKAIGQRSTLEIGSISQSVMGYAGQRVRFSAQVKTAGTDGWAGLVVGQGWMPLYLRAGIPDGEQAPPALGAAGCPQWCDVSVVADIRDNLGVVAPGLALIGNGQVWARAFKLEVVGADVPVTTHRFAADVDAALKARHQRFLQSRAAKPTPPQNLALD